MSNNELERLEKFSKSLTSQNTIEYSKDITRLNYLYKKYIRQLDKEQYLHFVPKDHTIASKARLKLAIDLKSQLNYYKFQSALIGINCLYFSLLVKKSKNVLGFSSFASIIFSSLVSFLFYKRFFIHYEKVVDNIFKEELIFLAEKIERKKQGFTDEVSKFKNFESIY